MRLTQRKVFFLWVKRCYAIGALLKPQHKGINHEKINEYKQNISADRVLVIPVYQLFSDWRVANRGTAEKAGQKIDRAAENAEQSDEATEKQRKKLRRKESSSISRNRWRNTWMTRYYHKVKTAILTIPCLTHPIST